MTFLQYLDILYGDKLTISDEIMDDLPGLLETGVLYDLNKHSWIHLDEECGEYRNRPIQLIEVVEINSPDNLELKISELRQVPGVSFT